MQSSAKMQLKISASTDTLCDVAEAFLMYGLIENSSTLICQLLAVCASSHVSCLVTALLAWYLSPYLSAPATWRCFVDIGPAQVVVCTAAAVCWCFAGACRACRTSLLVILHQRET